MRSGGSGARGVAAWLVAAAVAAGGPAWAAEVPYLAARITDQAGLVDAAAEERLDALLEDFESRTGAQIAVLTIVSLNGEPVEDYSLRVAETWALGRAGSDDGVLFLVARDDRRMRIEVGYGLEGELTDVEAGRILRNVVTPRFQGGDFGGGIEAGVLAILATLEGAAEPPVEVERVAGGATRGPGPRDFVSVAVTAVFSLAAIFASGAASWVLFLALAPIWVVLTRSLAGGGHGLWGLAVWAVVFALARWLLSTPAGRRWLEARRAERFPWGPGDGSGRGGWGGGGWSGGGSSGGGFSGGGFSGGGGSFGGGGASGRW